MIFIPPLFVIYGDEDMPLIVIIACNVLSGVGTGYVSIAFAVIREYNDYNQCSDVATGIVNTINISSAFAMQWIIGILMDINLNHRYTNNESLSGERMYNVDDYNFGFTVIPIVGIIGIILSFFMKETHAISVHFKYVNYFNTKNLINDF